MKTLEKKYSKIERVVAKGKFSACVYLRTVLLAVILGGLTAVIWVFKDKIEGLFTKTEPAQYLTALGASRRGRNRSRQPRHRNRAFQLKRTRPYARQSGFQRRDFQRSFSRNPSLRDKNG